MSTTMRNMWKYSCCTYSVATAQLKKDMDNKVIQGGKFDDKSTNAEREEHLVCRLGVKGEIGLTISE